MLYIEVASEKDDDNVHHNNVHHVDFQVVSQKGSRMATMFITTISLAPTKKEGAG